MRGVGPRGEANPSVPSAEHASEEGSEGRGREDPRCDFRVRFAVSERRSGVGAALRRIVANPEAAARATRAAARKLQRGGGKGPLRDVHGRQRHRENPVLFAGIGGERLRGSDDQNARRKRDVRTFQALAELAESRPFFWNGEV